MTRIINLMPGPSLAAALQPEAAVGIRQWQKGAAWRIDESLKSTPDLQGIFFYILLRWVCGGCEAEIMEEFLGCRDNE